MNIKQNKNKLWVEIEVNKYTDGITVFRGQLFKDDLLAWASGDLADGALKLEDTYWYAEDAICYLGKGTPASQQYTGESYLRVDTIMTILVLRDESLLDEASVSAKANIFPFPGRIRNKKPVE